MTPIIPHGRSLYAAYDLSVSPSSFDVLSFLVEAEKVRKDEGLDAIHMLIVPGTRNFDVLGAGQDQWRLANIVLPACGLLPSVHGVTVAASRDQAQHLIDLHAGSVFPAGYTIERAIAHHHTAWPVVSAHCGVNLQCLGASPQARRYARQWIDARAHGRKAIALTLREVDTTILRNSDIGEWTRFARLLQEAGYFPIIVRDTDRALDRPPPPFDGLPLFSEAAFNLDLRIALYEECHIAAFVSNGPSHAGYFDRDVRYLYFVTGEWRKGNPPAFYRVGVGEDTCPPFCNDYQRWVWCEQDADLFMQELLSLDAKIEAARANGTYESGLSPIEAYREPLEIVADRIRQYGDRHFSSSDWEIIAFLMERLSPERLYVDLDFTFEMARASFLSRDFDKAIALFRYVIGKAPTEQVYLQFGMGFEALERWEEARAIYREAVATLPSSLLLHLRLNITEAELGNTDTAATFFRYLIARGITAPQVFLELGKIYERKSDWFGALAVYNEAMAKGGLNQQVLARKLEVAQKIAGN